MKYDVYIDKTYRPKFTVHAESQVAAEAIAKAEAGVRMFHEEKPEIKVANIQEAP